MTHWCTGALTFVISSVVEHWHFVISSVVERWHFVISSVVERWHFVISSVVERSLHALRLVEMTERITTF